MRSFEEVGSTNADLLVLAAEGAVEGLVLVADHQTAGRGRLDRTWEALPGSSLLVSVLLRPHLHPDDTFLLTNAAAAAAVVACHEVSGVRPGVKWPNDLVIVAGDRFGGHKLGGILAEARIGHGGVEAVVIGMGLNVNWPPDLPPELAEVAVALNHVVGHEVDREDLLVAWLQQLENRLASLERPEGRLELLAEVRRVSATLGRSVRVELPDGRTVEGSAVDLTPSGHLVVAPDDGSAALEVTVGDVVHLRHRA